MKSKKNYPIVLSIAGSDSSGGAGVQADLKTFSALGVYGATAITAITAQNTLGVHSQLAINPQMVYDQIVAVLDDLHPSFVKIGMLSNVEIVYAVAEALSRYSLSIILDPVIVSSSGHRLLSVEAQDVIKEKLLPMATLVTPNIPEMETLTNMHISNFEEKGKAARHLMDYGVKSVLLKGGHEDGEVKTDLLFIGAQELRSSGAQELMNSGTSEFDSANHCITFSSKTISTKNIHGTGCTLSSAIAAFMARGLCLEDAVAEAKKFISNAIEAGADVEIGHGFGPVNHGFNPLKMCVYDVR